MKLVLVLRGQNEVWVKISHKETFLGCYFLEIKDRYLENNAQSEYLWKSDLEGYSLLKGVSVFHDTFFRLGLLPERVPFPEPCGIEGVSMTAE